MEPIVLESAEEQNCLSDLTTSTNWKYNFNYWTGGTQQGCKGQWKWCGAVDPTIKTSLQWAPNQPDNKGGNESCLHLRIFNNATYFGVKLTDRNCTDKYVYACQVNIKRIFSLIVSALVVHSLPDYVITFKLHV
jgi:Lectin C-type domain